MSPKTYFIKDETSYDTKDVKKALKGIHSQEKVQQEDFLDALYQNKLTKVAEMKLQNNIKKKRCELVENEKNAINAIYTKLRVEDDQVTVRPLRLKDGSLI